MKGRFGLSVGVAAMDGLLCAFMAVLMLAFVIQLPPQPEQSVPSMHRSASPQTVIVAVDKSGADVLSGETNTRIVIRAEVDGKLGWVKYGETLEVGGVAISWSDCSSVQGPCTGHLIAGPISIDEPINVVIHPADSIEGAMPMAVSVEPSIMDWKGNRYGAIGSRTLKFSSPCGLAVRLGLHESGPSVQWASDVEC